MQCLSNEQILNYINQELTQAEHDEFQNHIYTCDKCDTKRHKYQQEISAIKESISLLDPPDGEVPELAFSQHRSSQIKMKNWYNSNMIKIGIAASMIILFGLLFLQKNNKQKFRTDYSQIGTELITTDLNTAWHEQQLIISITDEKNKVIDCYLISKKE